MLLQPSPTWFGGSASGRGDSQSLQSRGRRPRINSRAGRRALLNAGITAPRHIPSAQSPPPFSPGLQTSSRSLIFLVSLTGQPQLRASLFLPSRLFRLACRRPAPLIVPGTSTSSFQATSVIRLTLVFLTTPIVLLMPAPLTHPDPAWHLLSTARALSLWPPLRQVCGLSRPWSA